MTKLHSYVVARDYGFAPNPFYGYCTLATCMVKIREGAELGDWIVGTGSKRKDRQGFLVYAMCVSEILSFDEYWNDPRFRAKRPDLHASMKKAFGDNIYHRSCENGPWHQADSHHSLSDGTSNEKNICHDTKVDRVLIGSEFVYFGGSGPKIPPFQETMVARPGVRYQCNFPEQVVRECIGWIRGLEDTGYCGAPMDWR